MKDKTIPTYYICEDCGELTTEDRLLEECSTGGSGMCYCRFLYKFWDEDLNGPDCETDKILMAYTKIKKKIYNWLLSEDNTVIRLRMFNTIPKKLLLNNNDI